MFSMKFEPIKTSRLVIVEYAPEYLNEVFAYRSLPEIYKPYTAKMDSPQALAEYFEEQITEFDNPEGGYSVFLILLNSKVIGEITVSFWDHNNEINEIGFEYATERCRWLPNDFKKKDGYLIPHIGNRVDHAVVRIACRYIRHCQRYNRSYWYCCRLECLYRSYQIGLTP